MLKVKYFFRNINFLNIILVAVIIIMINYAVRPFFYTNINVSVSSLKRTSAEQYMPPAREFSSPSLADYALISEENLFHPERQIPPEKKAEQEMPKPEFVLYGTMVSDNVSIAYLEDLKAPRTSAGRGKRQVSLRKGDTFSGYTLKEIEADKIVMVRGEDRITVPVLDPQRPKTRETATTATATAPKRASGQPARTPARAATARTNVKPAIESLIKRQPLPRTRAPMTPAEERARSFFTK